MDQAVGLSFWVFSKRLARRIGAAKPTLLGKGEPPKVGETPKGGCPVLSPKLEKFAGFTLKILKELKDARVLGFLEVAYLLGCGGGLVGDIPKRWV